MFMMGVTIFLTKLPACYRSLAKEMNITWAEYWAFLDSFMDITKKEGLMKLEAYFQAQAKKLLVSNEYYDVDTV